MTERDAPIMAAVGEDLLARPTIGLESAASRRYLLAAVIAGNLAQDKRNEALTLWQRYEKDMRAGKDAPLGIELRFLQAHALRAR